MRMHGVRRTAFCGCVVAFAIFSVGCAGQVPVGSDAKFGYVTWEVGYKLPDFTAPNSDLGLRK